MAPGYIFLARSTSLPVYPYMVDLPAPGFGQSPYIYHPLQVVKLSILSEDIEF